MKFDIYYTDITRILFGSLLDHCIIRSKNGWLFYLDKEGVLMAHPISYEHYKYQ